MNQALPCLLERRVYVSLSKCEHHKIGAETILPVYQEIG